MISRIITGIWFLFFGSLFNPEVETVQAQDTNIEYYYIEDESHEIVERVPKSIEYLKSLIK